MDVRGMLSLAKGLAEKLGRGIAEVTAAEFSSNKLITLR